MVAGAAFPGAGGVGNAILKKLGMDGVGGEVVVVFHYHGVVALGDDGVVPDGFHRLGVKEMVGRIACPDRNQGYQTTKTPVVLFY